ncbi:MAG: MATE family efflux transporter [Phycisphaerales bacterium JB039]
MPRAVATLIDWRAISGVMGCARILGQAEQATGLTADGRLRTGRLAGLTMGGAIWVLSWPILVESALNSLVGLTDTTLAARLPEGEAATDAIGGASYMMWFIGLIIMAMGVGATALISRSIGKGRVAVANAALGQTLVLAVTVGGATGAFIALIAPYLPAVIGLSPEAAPLFTEYMRIIAGGVPFMGILFAGIACARGAGDSVRPLHAMIVRNIVNIGVSFALCGVDLGYTTMTDDGPVTTVFLRNPFEFNLGVFGIALGTVIGDAVGAGVILWMAGRGVWGIRLRRARIAPHWHTIRRLVRLGVPNFLETLGMWFGNFLILLIVGRLAVGAAGGLVGSHIVAIRIESFSFLPGFAMGMAAATLAGQYLGAGSPARAIRAVLICAGIGGGFMGFIGLIFILFPYPLTAALTEVPAHLEQAPKLLFICGLVQLPFGLGLVFRSALRGAGDVRVVMILTWTTTYLIRLPLSWLLSGVVIPLPGGGEIPNPLGLEPSLSRLWIAMCAELAIRGAIFSLRFAQGTWTRAQV